MESSPPRVRGHARESERCPECEAWHLIGPKVCPDCLAAWRTIGGLAHESEAAAEWRAWVEETPGGPIWLAPLRVLGRVDGRLLIAGWVTHRPWVRRRYLHKIAEKFGGDPILASPQEALAIYERRA